MSRARWAVGLALVAAVSAGCSAGSASDGPDVSSTSAPATSETVSMPATDLIDKWSSRLQDAHDILQPCRPKPFDNPCLEGMDQLGTMARSLEKDARKAGFTSLAEAASEVDRKTHRWLSECIYTKRNTPERVDCWADASGVIYGGGAGMLKGELYATTRTS